MICVRFPCYQPEMKLQKAPFLRYVGIHIIHVQFAKTLSLLTAPCMVWLDWYSYHGRLGEFCHTRCNPSSFVAGNLQSESESPATGILLYTHINVGDGHLTNTVMSQPTMFQPQVHPVNLAQEKGRVQVAVFRNGGFFSPWRKTSKEHWMNVIYSSSFRFGCFKSWYTWWNKNRYE